MEDCTLGVEVDWRVVVLGHELDDVYKFVAAVRFLLCLVDLLGFAAKQMQEEWL